VKVHNAKNNKAHGAMDKEHHTCARRRIGELAVSQTVSSLRTGARFTTCRLRHVTLVNAGEMVRRPCPLRRQSLVVQVKSSL